MFPNAWRNTWQPPERDVKVFLNGSNSVANLCHKRRKTNLAFWQVGQNGSPFQLVSRINKAHHTNPQWTEAACKPRHHMGR